MPLPRLFRCSYNVAICAQNKRTDMLDENDVILLGLYFANWLIMLYLFGMQRATLLISRTSNVDWKSVGAHLLPKWYPITMLFRFAKWSVLILVFWQVGWMIGLVCLIADIVLTGFVPIPYKTLYSGIFNRRVAELSNQDPELGSTFRSLLDNSGFPRATF